MIVSERKKLDEYPHEYLCIGITETGEGVNSISVPWEQTTNAFNMKVPRIYISRSDLQDAEIMSRIKRFKVIGCYIFAPLEDYDFLNEFPCVRDLFIAHGGAIRDISFLRSFDSCAMLYIEDAQLENLDVIIDIKKSMGKRSVFDRPFVCVGLYDCKINDLSSLADRECCFSEFNVWGVENDRERWKKTNLKSLSYYLIKY